MRETARTWREVGARPMSRRDRAAMAYAMELVRCGASHSVLESHLRRAGGVSYALSHALSDSWRVFFQEGRGPVPARLIVARLALALRVLLRVDAGDYGRRVVCPECGVRLSEHYAGGEPIVCGANGTPRSAWRTCRVRPLWDGGIPHDATPEQRAWAMALPRLVRWVAT